MCHLSYKQILSPAFACLDSTGGQRTVSASLEIQRQSVLVAKYPAIARAFLFSDFFIFPGKKGNFSLSIFFSILSHNCQVSWKIFSSFWNRLLSLLGADISLGGFQSLSGPTTSHGLAKSLTTTWDLGLFILTFIVNKMKPINANHWYRTKN